MNLARFVCLFVISDLDKSAIIEGTLALLIQNIYKGNNPNNHMAIPDAGIL
jgi:hypothetical protein